MAWRWDGWDEDDQWTDSMAGWEGKLVLIQKWDYGVHGTYLAEWKEILICECLYRTIVVDNIDNDTQQ
jgi:hypothetical protein